MNGMTHNQPNIERILTKGNFEEGPTCFLSKDWLLAGLVGLRRF